MLRLHSSKVLVLLFHRLVCETERPGAGRRPARQRSRRYIKAVRPCSNYTVVKFCPRFFIGSLARRWLACETGSRGARTASGSTRSPARRRHLSVSPHPCETHISDGTSPTSRRRLSAPHFPTHIHDENDPPTKTVKNSKESIYNEGIT